MTTKKADARMDTMGDATDSRTASADVPDAHTPGPWHVAKGSGGYVFTDGDPYGCGQMHVAQVRGWGHLTGKGGGCAFDDDKAIAIQDANARLIAAAPDLLAALHAIRKYVISEHDTALVEAAIAKAEGR